MLPVRVNVTSSSKCSLSEASQLLKRFASTDLSSDSYAKSYVRNVAVALDECVSRREGASTATASVTGGPERLQRRSIGSAVAGPDRGNLWDAVGSSGLVRCGKRKYSVDFLDDSLGGRKLPESPRETPGRAGLDVSPLSGSGMRSDHDRGEFQSAASDVPTKKHKKRRRHSIDDDSAPLMAQSGKRMGLAYEDSGDKRSEGIRKKERKDSDISAPNKFVSLAENIIGVAPLKSSDLPLPPEYQRFSSEKEKRRKSRKHRHSGTHSLS